MLSILLVGLVCFVQSQPTPAYPFGLNRYCAGRIIDPVANPTCVHLLQSNPVYTDAPGYSRLNEVVIDVFKVPALPPILNATEFNLDNAFYGTTNGTSAQDAYQFGQADVPREITFPLPYCATGSFSYSTPTTPKFRPAYAANGTSFFSELQPGLGECGGFFLYNYRPLCAAKNTAQLDMHCSVEATTFEECRVNQTLVTVTRPSTAISIGGLTTAVAPAAYESLSRASYTRPLDGCSDAGTQAWTRRYGQAIPSTVGSGIPSSDIGGPSSMMGTVTYVRNAPGTECGEILDFNGWDSIQFTIPGTFASGVTSPDAAIPVQLQFVSGDSTTTRIAYAPYLHCDPTTPRPPSSAISTARISLHPYCRHLDALTNEALNQIPRYEDVLPSSNHFDGDVIYVISASGLPVPGLLVYARVKFAFPTNPSLDYTTKPMYLEPSSRIYLSRPLNSRVSSAHPLVYLQSFSPENEYELVYNQANLGGLEVCKCPYTPDMAGANLACGLDNPVPLFLFIETERDSPPIYSGMPNEVTVRGDQPVCSIRLLNGYEGLRDGILQQGLYTVEAVVTNGNIFQWIAEGPAPGTVSILSGANTLTAVIQVNSKVNAITMRFSATDNSFPAVPVIGRCSLPLRVFEGLPIAILSPGAALLNVGQSVVLNGSRSYSTTPEFITWSWSFVFPADGNGGSISSTGNTSVITFTGLDIGTYGIGMRVSNPRVSVNVQAVITVIQQGAGNTTDLPSTCITSIGNIEIGDPDLPDYNETRATEYRPQAPQVKPDPFYGPSSSTSASSPGQSQSIGDAEEGVTVATTLAIAVPATLVGVVLLVGIFFYLWKALSLYRTNLQNERYSELVQMGDTSQE